jgi:hypothetical protein
MAYIGAPFFYNLKPLGSSAGIFGMNAFVVTNEFVFWAGPDGFYIYDGTIRELNPDINDLYQDRLTETQTAKINCGHNPKFDEVWVFYPSRNSDECDEYVVWNYVDNVWTIGQLPRTIWDQALIWENPVASKPITIEASTVTLESLGPLTLDQWTKLGTTNFNIELLEVWNDAETIQHVLGTDYEADLTLGAIRSITGGAIPDATSVKVSYNILGAAYSILYKHEESYLDDGLSRSDDVYLTLAPFEIGVGDNLAVARKLIQDTGREDDPDPLLNSEAVQVEFKTRLVPEAVATVEGPYSLDPVRGYTDVRFTGRQVEMTFRQVRDELWRIGRYRLEIVPGSRR